MRRKILLIAAVLSIFCFIFGNINAMSNEDLYEFVSKSVVRVVVGQNSDPDEVGWGTGFFISDKLIVTNHHCVTPYLEDGYVGGKGWFKSAENQTVTVIYSHMNNDMVNGLVIKDWPEVDLAVIELSTPTTKRTPLKLWDEESAIRMNMPISVVGFPGVETSSSMHADAANIKGGNISKIDRDSIQRPNGTSYLSLSVSATINPGNSGGPIVDNDGNVVGIANSSIRTDSSTAFFGIHVKELTTRLKQNDLSFTPAGKTTGKDGKAQTSGGSSEKAGFPWIWVVIGVLGAAVVAMLIVLLTKKPDDEQKSGAGAGGSAPVPSGKEASIQGMTGQFTGHKKNLSKEKDCFFGRNEQCTIRFSNDATRISDKHCRIHYSKSNQRYVVQDLGSTNGTVIVRGSRKQAVPKKSAIALRDGDMIYIVDKNNAFRVNL